MGLIGRGWELRVTTLTSPLSVRFIMGSIVEFWGVWKGFILNVGISVLNVKSSILGLVISLLGFIFIFVLSLLGFILVFVSFVFIM